MSSKKTVENKNSINDWKRLWQLVSGIHYAPSENTVKETLLDISKELQDGILQFKTASSSTKTIDKLLKEKKQEKLIGFTQKLQQILDLESNQCWEILCFYLTNEYRGRASSLTTLTSTETNITKLLEDIWGYYTLERMIVLKIVKNLLEFYENRDNPYHAQYKFILDKITFERLKTSYIDQFEYLVKESPPHRLTTGEFLNSQTKLIDWNERNCRETIEILHILLLIANYTDVKSSELKRLFECFQLHSFGKTQRYLIDRDIHNQLKNKIMYSELALFMRCIDVAQTNRDHVWIKEIIDMLNKQILTLHTKPEHGPLLLTWMLFNFHLIDNADETSILNRKFRQYGGKAVQLNVFEFLRDLVGHQMFRDDSLSAKIVRKTVYNHVSHLCDLFDEDGSVGQHNGIYELLYELLQSPEIGNDFCKNEDSGVRSLYNTVLENFPVDFINVSEIAYSLSKSGQTNYVKNQLENLPIYKELYDGYKIKLVLANAAEDDEYILTHNYSPFKNIDYVIPSGTSAAIIRNDTECYVHFRTKLDYFNVLRNEINLLISESTQSTHIDTKRLERVNAGLKYLTIAIANMETPSEITPEMVHPIEMCIDLLNKFQRVQSPPLLLLANCLHVCAGLLPFFKNDIFTRVLSLNILPFLRTNDLDYKKYAVGMSFDSSLIGTFLINIESKEAKYDLFFAYLNFLHKFTEVNADDKADGNKLYQMEIPGIIFLLCEVFPHISSWRFETAEDRNRMYKEVMKFICGVLDSDIPEGMKDFEARHILRNICVSNLLNLDNGTVLLRFIAISNAFLQASMEMESNWLAPSSHGIIWLVRQSMRILMNLLRLKTTIFERTLLSPVESLIYTQPKQRDTLRIIPVVTSYMNNIFDRSLPILSCRLLRRISLEFNMSLLACLDMEPDQIRLIFLQHLPDDLESVSLKIAILEFVGACIEKQPGLTEAFFKINSDKERRLFPPKEKESNIADSIVTFMDIYLESVAVMPSIVEGPLPTSIMGLFHAIWKNNMQGLVDELTRKPNFWSSLCSPLFSDTFKENVKAYSQIFNMLGLEIFSSRPKQKLENNLKEVLSKFFEQGNFEKWISHVFDLPYCTTNEVVTEVTPEWLCRLQSFKDFMIVILNKSVTTFEIPFAQQKTLAVKCLQVLVSRSEYTDDLRPFVILSELYLIILFNFKHSYTHSEDEDCAMLSEITKLLHNVSLSYDNLHFRAKESCLSISIKATNLLSGELIKDIHVALGYLHPIVKIICTELDNLENVVKRTNLTNSNSKDTNVLEKSKRTERHNSLILSLNLLKTLACIFDNEGLPNWDNQFVINSIFNRLLTNAKLVLQMHSKRQISAELLDALLVFAKGICSKEVINCDVGDYLWLSLLPPKELLQAPYILQHPGKQQPKNILWTAQQWWPIYSRGIELVTILFQENRHQFLSHALFFIGIHEQFLIDSMNLVNQSFEPNAVILIKNTVYLISQLVEFEQEWKVEHAQSRYNLLRCIRSLLSHSISLFNQPKNLKRLMYGSKVGKIDIQDATTDNVADDLITAMNHLTEITTICVKCLLPFSPSLMELICEPEFTACKWEAVMEIQFGPPKLNDPNYLLSFGTVLSAVGIFTKALSLQGYRFHEIPLNEIPKSKNLEESVAKNLIGTTSIPGQQSNYTKSVSIVSTVPGTFNELLSNLDGEQCLAALEHILTLTASQSLLALKNSQLSIREKQIIRREISTELIIFHDFVRKKVLNDFREFRDIWHRKKRGITMMSDCEVNSQPGTSKPSYSATTSAPAPTPYSSEHKNSMRVNVVRRLHLQHKPTSNPDTPLPPAASSVTQFEMTQIISPILKQIPLKSDLKSGPPIFSTPNLARPPIRLAPPDDETRAKRVQLDENEMEMEQEQEVEEEEEQQIEYLEPEQPKYSPLSFVAFVEEDYLHCLSNLFTVICQSD